MIISDISYQEFVDESNKLEGGYDIGVSLTAWNSHAIEIGTMSTSGPGGSTTMTGAAKVDISSIGISFIGLGLS
ncbi:MAG: hypothetical protein ACP5RH_00885 [Leptodesmis sp.]|uniref:hypothetical protein n=1 Tax=Leptodesmis sp. TaxID=3100501 RepID=UPI003D0F7C11